MGAEAAAAPTAVAPSDGFEGCGGSVAEAVDLHLQSAVKNLLFCKFAATHVIWKAKVWGRMKLRGALWVLGEATACFTMVLGRAATGGKCVVIARGE
jgi:hypothetical protein